MSPKMLRNNCSTTRSKQAPVISNTNTKFSQIQFTISHNRSYKLPGEAEALAQGQTSRDGQGIGYPTLSLYPPASRSVADRGVYISIILSRG